MFEINKESDDTKNWKQFAVHFSHFKIYPIYYLKKMRGPWCI